MVTDSKSESGMMGLALSECANEPVVLSVVHVRISLALHVHVWGHVLSLFVFSISEHTDNRKCLRYLRSNRCLECRDRANTGDSNGGCFHYRAHRSVIGPLKLKSKKNSFTNRFAGFDEGVSLFHVRGVDQTEVRPGRGAKETRIDQFGNLGEQASLFLHVSRLKPRAAKHKLPVERKAFRFQFVDIDGSGEIFDQDHCGFRSHCFDDFVKVILGSGESQNIIHAIRDNLLHLRRQGLAMINHVVGTHLAAPVHRLGTRSAGDDRHTGKPFGELYRNRSNTSCAANDKDRSLIGDLVFAQG